VAGYTHGSRHTHAQMHEGMWGDLAGGGKTAEPEQRKLPHLWG